MRRVFVIVFLLLLMGLPEAKAQSVVTSMGGMGIGNDGSFTAVMGYTSYSDNTATLTTTGAGASFKFEFASVTSIGEPLTAFEVSAYPNPTRQVIHLKLEPLNGQMAYELAYLDGRVLQSGPILEQLTSIGLQLYSGPFFLLNITHQGSVVKRLKIIKH